MFDWLMSERAHFLCTVRNGADEEIIDEAWAFVREETMTSSETVFDGILSAHRDVGNGGFHQYFCNAHAHAVMETWLRSVGAKRFAELFQAAACKWPSQEVVARGAAQSLDERERQLQEAGLGRETFSAIEDAYYSLGDEELERALANYVRENVDQFGPRD